MTALLGHKVARSNAVAFEVKRASDRPLRPAAHSLAQAGRNRLVVLGKALSKAPDRQDQSGSTVSSGTNPCA
jgi:hypothetical protein